MGSIRWFFNNRLWQPTVEEWMLAAQRIQQEEKERIEKFVFKRDGKASMVLFNICSDSIAFVIVSTKMFQSLCMNIQNILNS